MSIIKKCQFARLNNKRYYFSGGIVSLPFVTLICQTLEITKKNRKKTKGFFFQSNKSERLRLKKQSYFEKRKVVHFEVYFSTADNLLQNRFWQKITTD